MARRPAAHNAPAPPASKKILTVIEMQRGIERLRERIAGLQAFNPAAMTSGQPPELTGMQVDIKGTLQRIFGDDTADFRRFAAACDIQWFAAMAFGNYPALSDYQEGVRNNIGNAIAILNQAIRFLEEEIADCSMVVGEPHEPSPARDLSKVFVVHGHDEGAREAIARFLERLRLQPIILHEQANQGRTVIEKVEAHGDVGFAVVLLTPDDEGAIKGGTPAPRARQNVVLELGYFIGRLGRTHVCALKRGDIEIPSDFAGVVYETFDSGNGWKQALARELQGAGFSVDWNDVMRP